MKKESKKQITKKYHKLMQRVKNDEFYDIDLTNRVNCYVCHSCHHITKTKDLDPGVTPFIYSCENCGKQAQSSFYNDIAPRLQPTVEWYRPSLEEFLKLDSSWLDHLFNGGLKDRKIPHLKDK